MPYLSASGDMRSKEKQATQEVQSHSEYLTPNIILESFKVLTMRWSKLGHPALPTVHQLGKVDSKHISGLDLSL